MSYTPEQQILAACLSNPDLIRTALEHTSGDEFRDHRLMDAWDLMVEAKSQGNPLRPDTFHLAVVDAGIRGLEPTDVWKWLDYVFSVSEATVARLAEGIHDGFMRRQLVAAVTSHRPDDGNIGETISSLIASLEGLRNGSTNGLLQGMDLGNLLDVNDDYDWLVEGLLEKGDRLMLTGGEGAGKTTFARQVAVCLAAGIHPFKLTPIKPLRVLVIDAENSYRQWKRGVTSMVGSIVGANPPADPRENMHVVSTARLDVSRESHIGAIHRKIDEFHPDVVVIGPLYKITSGAITNDDDAAPVLAALDGIRDRGLAMIIEAHAGKGTNSVGDRNLAPRGSSALLGWPEFGIGLRLVEEECEGYTRVVELTRWRGDRDGDRDWPSKLTSAGPLAWNDPDAPIGTPRSRFYSNDR